ncbi:MAG: O-antigen ligase family protein [Lentisphaeria bacterium]
MDYNSENDDFDITLVEQEYLPPSLVFLTGVLFVGAGFLYTLVLLGVGTAHIPSHAVTYPYRAIFLGGCLVCIIAGIRFHLLEWRLKLLFPLVLFFTLYTTRVILDGFVNNIPLEESPYYYLAMSLGACFIPALAFLQRFPSKFYKFSFYFLVVVGFVLAIGISVVFSEWIGQARIKGKITQIGFGPLHAGHFGAIFSVLGFYLLFMASRLRTFIIGGAMILFGFPPFVLGASRASLLSLVMGAILTYGSRIWKSTKIWPTVVLFLLLITGTLITYYSPFIDFTNVLLRRMPEFEGATIETTLDSRFGLWSNAWYQFTNSPLFGSGLVLEYSRSYPHNLFLEVFMATGILGGLSALIFFGVTIWSALKLLFFLPEAKQYAWLPLLFFHYLNYAMFSGALYVQTGLWCTAGAVLGLSAKIRFEQEQWFEEYEEYEEEEDEEEMEEDEEAFAENPDFV